MTVTGYKNLTQWLLEQTEIDPQAKIDRHNTLLLVDCHKHFSDSNCRSLLIDQHRGIVGSPKETKRLLNEWLEQQTFGLIWQRSVQKSITKKERAESLVIVHGNSMFVPVKGATQHSTSWVAMHNLASKIYYLPNKPAIQLNFKMANASILSLEMPANCSFFRRQYEIAQKMMLQQWQTWRSAAAELKIEEDSLLFKSCLAEVDRLEYIHPREIFNLYQRELWECYIKGSWDEHCSPKEFEKNQKDVKRRYDYF